MQNLCQWQKQKKHDCRKNHTGSSKSMEPDVAVDLFKRAVENNVKYNIYTGDDDATTQAHIRDQVPYEVEKYSDTVHTKRSLVSKLYALKSNKKFPGCSQLSVKVIGYLGKCFGYCVAQHKNNPRLFKLPFKTLFLMPLASTKTVMMCGVITGKNQRAINIMTYLWKRFAR